MLKYLEQLIRKTPPETESEKALQSPIIQEVLLKPLDAGVLIRMYSHLLPENFDDLKQPEYLEALRFLTDQPGPCGEELVPFAITENYAKFLSRLLAIRIDQLVETEKSPMAKILSEFVGTNPVLEQFELCSRMRRAFQKCYTLSASER